MFDSMRSLIDFRLGGGMVIDDFVDKDQHFIKIHHQHLYSVISFLKNDPDAGLTLLDQIISSPAIFACDKREHISLVYQLKSIKLPYRVSLVIEIDRDKDSPASIAPLFAGARWLEEDIGANLGLIFDEGGER